jgi:hypothetical protein
MRGNDQLEVAIVKWFEEQGWAIEVEGGHVVAVMSSGYGSGPTTVDITDLCKRYRAASEEDGP